MQSSKRPTKAQQDWQDWQREQGCCNCGAPNPSIHHCVGSTAKHNKVHIGQWWTIPLCYECHQGDQGIHHGMGRFVFDTRKENEKDMFEQMISKYYIEHSMEPMDREVYNAVMSYRR